MKIRIRFDNKLTHMEIPDGDYTLMLDADYEMRLAEAPEHKKEGVIRCNTIQEMFDLMNKTEYNNWHKFDRYFHDPEKGKSAIGGQVFFTRREDEEGSAEGVRSVVDYIPDHSDELKRGQVEEYEYICDIIRKTLKPDQAELIIAIYLDGIPATEYADKKGVSKSAISHRLNTAKKNLKKVFPNSSTFLISQGY